MSRDGPGDIAESERGDDGDEIVQHVGFLFERARTHLGVLRYRHVSSFAAVQSAMKTPGGRRPPANAFAANRFAPCTHGVAGPRARGYHQRPLRIDEPREIRAVSRPHRPLAALLLVALLPLAPAIAHAQPATRNLAFKAQKNDYAPAPGGQNYSAC